jgi:hypothetical protein
MWAIITVFAKSFIESAQKQGFSIMLLLLVSTGLMYMLKLERDTREKQVQTLSEEVKACRNEVIQYYREDRAMSNEIILKNTEVLLRLERKLDINIR